jgi:hypothetical protein
MAAKFKRLITPRGSGFGAFRLVRQISRWGKNVQFKALRALIAGAAGVIACAAWPTAGFSAPDRVYTIANYPVDAVDKNAVAAKEKALADGQQAAFRSLLKRIVPVTAYKQLSRVSQLKAVDFVSGFSVRSERNSATQYLASLDFSFEPNSVRSALTQNGIPFIDQQADTITVVTAVRQGNPPTAANDTSTWQRAWSGLDLDHSVTPFKIEALKPQIHNDTVNMLLGGDDNALRILAGEYGTSLILLAIAEPELADNKLTITLAGRDAVGPILWKRVYRISDSDFAYAAEFAAVVSLGVLEGRWKAAKSGSVGDAGPMAGVGGAAQSAPVWSSAANSGASMGDPVSFVAEFGTQAQWDEIRAQLLDTPGVEALENSTGSSTNAQVSLTYPGGARQLANALGGRGLVLTDFGAGWILRTSY